MTAASGLPDQPADFNALVALALREQSAGRFAEAEAAYCRILALRPDIAEVYNNLGVVLASQGRLDQAAARYQQAIALRPDFVETHSNLGNVLRDQGQLAEAIASFQQAIALRHDYVDAHISLGVAFRRQGRLDQAVASYQTALALQPSRADLHSNLANALAEHGQREQALAHYQQAIALRPDYAEAYNNLGNLLLGDGQLDAAVVRYEQALALRPDYAEALNHLGSALTHQGKFDQALVRYHQALALRPDYAEALNNLALTLREQLKLAEARQVFERLAALRPAAPDGQLGLATCYLIAGDYQRGWPAYEARLRMPELAPQCNPPCNLPRWSGEPLAGRRLLLLAEQGLGDTLQFIRYARLLRQQGAHVVLAAPAALDRLLANHPDVDELFLLGSAAELPSCDFYLPLLSAPLALATDAATIPCQVPYIAADAELTVKWRQEMAAIDGFKIAIAWQGSRAFSWDRFRSIPLAHFAPLARLPGVRLISLQKGIGREQIATVDFPVLDLSDRLDDQAGPFMDTAALIRNVDLVITSDTSIPHLAGALGAPVWVALQRAPNWRWLLDREDSPWYPTMRLFRQATSCEWSDVFERIANAVRNRCSGSAGSL